MTIFSRKLILDSMFTEIENLFVKIHPKELFIYQRNFYPEINKAQVRLRLARVTFATVYFVTRDPRRNRIRPRSTRVRKYLIAAGSKPRGRTRGSVAPLASCIASLFAVSCAEATYRLYFTIRILGPRFRNAITQRISMKLHQFRGKNAEYVGQRRKPRIGRSFSRDKSFARGSAVN